MNIETINEYYLERFALGELSEEDNEDIRRLVSTNPELQDALEELKSSNRDILALYPPPIVRASLLTQIQQTPHKSFPLRRIFTISSVLAAFLVLILVIPLFKKEPRIIYPDSVPDITLAKGIPAVDLSKTQLLVYRKIQDKVEIMTDGKRASTGDLLQLAYVTAEETHGVILSIDGRGLVSLHFPGETGGSTVLELNKQFLLKNAIELDDAPGFERFFFLTSGSPIDVDAVLKKVRDQAEDAEFVKIRELDLPESLQQYSILILKGEGS